MSGSTEGKKREWRGDLNDVLLGEEGKVVGRSVEGRLFRGVLLPRYLPT